ncbi:MAG: hypothetical protein A2079_00355 [Geobacteraceae bacterium GWC2_48_7]|nr:MAG: hypothetical protein A2079_00355 [Geobacteraceae bacterium GWC2_48_7]
MQELKDTRSLADLFSELTRETRTLFRKEMELLKTELTEKMMVVAKDMAALAVGAVLLFSGFLTLIAAIVAAVALFLPVWLAALITGMLFIIIGFAFIQKARKDMKQLKLKPEKSSETFKETAQWLKTTVSR